MIWLIGIPFGHDHPYYINDYKRPIHHRIKKQRAQESLESQENIDATSNNLRNMTVSMGKGPKEGGRGVMVKACRS